MSTFARPSRWWQMGMLVVVLLYAGYLRFTGLGFDLPLVNEDEPGVVEFARAIHWGDLNPHLFYYGSLPYYVLRVAIWLLDWSKPFLTGMAPVVSDYYLLARAMSATFGLITVYLVFVFGSTIGGRAVGLLAAAFFGLSPLAIDLAHLAKVDAMMGLWAALAFVAMAYWLKGRRYWMVVAAISVGLAIGSKFNAVVLALPLFTILFQQRWREQDSSLRPGQQYLFYALVVLALIAYGGAFLGRGQILAHVASWTATGQLKPTYVHIFQRLLLVGFLVLGAGLVLSVGLFLQWRWTHRTVGVLMSRQFAMLAGLVCFAFLLSSPFVLLDFRTFARDFFFQVNKSMTGGLVGLPEDSRSYTALASSPFRPDPLRYLWAIRAEWGVPIFAMMAVGLGAFWHRNRVAFIALMPMPVLLLAMTTTWRYQAVRWVYPVWPILVLLAALGIDSVLRTVLRLMPQRTSATRFAQGLLWSLVLLLLWGPATSANELVHRRFLLPDTRYLALRWVEVHLTPEATILRGPDTPDIERIDPEYRVLYSWSPFEEVSLAEWENRGVTVIMISTGRRDFYQAHPAKFRDILAEYQRLQDRWTLSKSFEPGPKVKGPPIYVYSAP